MRSATSLRTWLLAPLGLAFLLFVPPELAIGAAPRASLSATESQSLPEPGEAPSVAPLSRPDPSPPGISRQVQCRKVCTYRVLKRRGVVVSRTATGCRLECPGMASRSCSTGECR